MKHRELNLKYRSNKNLLFSETDELSMCGNKEYFLSYPKKVNYSFNSRGFRDAEWPSNNLHECIWCIGDSATVGIGQPVSETWTSLLQECTGTRTINISMSGASNTWISRKSSYILKCIQPFNMVIQWTYTSRREILDETLPDQKRRLSAVSLDNFLLDKGDTADFFECVLNVERNKNNTNVIHSFVPNICDSKIMTDCGFWELFADQHNINDLKVVCDNTQLDYARDHIHYGIKTCKQYINGIIKKGLKM